MKQVFTQVPIYKKKNHKVVRRPTLLRKECCDMPEAFTHLGDIFAESMAFELLALYPHFCIFLLSLVTHSFWSSTFGARRSNSLA